MILDAAELQRLFGQLGIQERAMIMIEALTGLRRSELMAEMEGRRLCFRSPRDHEIGCGPSGWQLQNRSIAKACRHR